MAQDTTPAIVVYRGNGDNSVPYDVPFDKGYYGEVKVAFIRRGLADYTYNPTTYTVNGRLYAWVNSGNYVYTHTPNPTVSAPTYNSYDVEQVDTVSAIVGQTITVGGITYTRAVQHDIANQLLLTWTGTVLTSNDFICIARETERGQPYEYPNNQKHIEYALDNLERQIQEVANKADNALLVDPSWSTDISKMNPIDWLKSIIRCMDFSVRAVRFANGWFDYSLDDPNIADADKTWVHLLNTDNIKAIRERSDVVDGVTIYWTEYQASDGTWRTLANTSEWDRKIQYAVDTADDAKSVADDAKDIAQDTKDIVDAFDDRLTIAEQDASDAKQDASDAKDIAQDASDVVSAHIADTNNPHSVTAAQAGALPNTTKYGAALSLTLDSTTYVVTAQLKDQDGNNLGTAQTIDLPLESVVVSGAYDSATKEVVLTLKDGSTIRFSVADLVSGLQTEITALNMLSADFVDDTNTTHKFVTTTEKTTWNGKQDAISDLATIRSGAAAGATAVQPSDLATVATSGSYNDLSDKPTIPAEETYWGIYNTTTFTDIKTAWDSGKIVLCKYSDRVYVATYYITGTTQFFYFTCVETYNSIRYLRVSSLNAWTQGSQANVSTSSIVSSISSSSTNSQIVGAKCVYDLLETKANTTDIPTTLAGLTGDVDISSPTNGQHLVYDIADQKWKNQTSAATVSWGGISGTLSDQTDLQNALDAKANTGMDNLTSTGANIGNWSSNVSNCITNIPQDIKLEFDTTTKVLTLKAGSKLYIPNGSGVFNEITINSDQTLTNTFSGQYDAIFVCWDSANNVMRQTPTVNSGTSDHSAASNRIWYDTTANKIKYYENAGTTVTSDSLSFPICIMQNAGSGGGFTKIQQVFNGFGYIGSTVFALPRVKGLIPNGRNADGTLKNIATEVTSVQTYTYTGIPSGEIYAGITSSGVIELNGDRTYNEVENVIYNGVNPELVCEFAKYRNPSGKIADFTLKTVYHALDWNDSSTISGWAMPSNRYINLTLGASGATYTAPADGYFTYMDNAGGVGLACLANWTNGLVNGTNAPAATWIRRVFLPAKKGDVVELAYENGGTNQRLRFIYAQGAQ